MQDDLTNLKHSKDRIVAAQAMILNAMCDLSRYRSAEMAFCVDRISLLSFHAEQVYTHLCETIKLMEKEYNDKNQNTNS